MLINGRPLSINWADKYVPAILEAWYPGSQGGTAIADALFGDYNPGGKLTVTFPKTVGQIPFNFPTKPNAQVDGGRNKGLDGNMSRVNGSVVPVRLRIELYDFRILRHFDPASYRDTGSTGHRPLQGDEYR